MWRRILAALGLLALVAVATVIAAGRGCFGSHEAPGVATDRRRAPELLSESQQALTQAARTIGAPAARQILFGDLHVHTTFSFDAFMLSTPLLVGEGSHPPADACDFARFCSQLDFWSLNDHAEGLTPQHWQESAEAIRQCNAVAGGGPDPDTVAFLGWEWTQVGRTPEDHYGHKNVVLRDTEDGLIPARPIASLGQAANAQRAAQGSWGLGLVALMSGEPRYHDMARYFRERADVAPCPDDVPSDALPSDCREYAATPGELFRKLDEAGHEAIVIPHGTTWGFYTPPGSTWDKQLSRAQHDPDRQTLIEVFSGHGNSEEYRPWRAVRFDADGTPSCPAPTPDYLPSCWRAGEIIRSRCLSDGETAAECETRAVAARANAAAAGVAGHLTVPGATPEEWLDAGQCRDCVMPAFNYRPGGSAQYIMALSNFDEGEDDDPLRFRFGFMASSDNHFARPGTGYKEVHRRGMTESNRRPRDPDSALARALGGPVVAPESRSQALDLEETELSGFQLVEFERQASFFMTGGLVAVHADGRGRDAIWESFQRREVYGTSGPRILLWFDLLNPPGASRGESVPMGAAVEMRANPIFQVRAVGSFEQKPGCPADSLDALGPDRLEQVCKGECYHPSDRRRRITRIEVVRIRPQAVPDEPVEPLIEDPWRVFECAPDPAGCVATFADPDFGRDGRDSLYYARAVEEPTPTINAGGVRCRFDAEGRCVEVDLCGEPDARQDDCLSEEEPRAWSSPIFVDHAGRS